ISLLTEPFTGFQQTGSYLIHAFEGDPGTPVTRIQPRSLLLPPGIPEFESRLRFLPPGRHLLTGRAWSGLAPVAGVEVSTDGGRSWRPAELEGQPSPWAWAGGRPSWGARRPPGPGPGGGSPGRRPQAPTSCARGPPTRPATPSRWR